MCWYAIAGQLAMQAYGIYAKNKENASYLEAQARGAYKQMNYAFQNYEIERQDAYDAAVNDIVKTRINQMQLNSQVNAAIAEGYAGGGRTANRLMRAAEADTSRTIASIQDNYDRKSNEVDLNKESTLLSTKDYIANLQKQGHISKWQKFNDIAALGMTALSGYNEYKTQKQDAQNAGGSFDFWGSHSAEKSKASTGGTFYYNANGLPSMYTYTNQGGSKIKYRDKFNSKLKIK
nr:internal virion protein [Autographiviridae sp.]